MGCKHETSLSLQVLLEAWWETIKAQGTLNTYGNMNEFIVHKNKTLSDQIENLQVKTLGF